MVMVWTVLLLALIGCCTIGCNGSSSNKEVDRQAILQLLGEYENRLRTGDAAALEQLYAEDAVFMRADAAAIEGKRAIVQMARDALNEIALDKKFEIQELVIEGDWAFARANSVGTVTVKATGTTGPEDHDDLFVLQRRDGVWKIARYIYNSKLPTGTH
ncbi:MAG: YybH family protein [Candidatus Binatia bacterium]